MWEKVTENLRDIARIYVISINSVHCSVCCWARGNVSQNAGWVETEDDRNWADGGVWRYPEDIYESRQGGDAELHHGTFRVADCSMQIP